MSIHSSRRSLSVSAGKYWFTTQRYKQISGLHALFSCQLSLRYSSECSKLTSCNSCCIVFPYTMPLHEVQRAHPFYPVSWNVCCYLENRIAFRREQIKVLGQPVLLSSASPVWISLGKENYSHMILCHTGQAGRVLQGLGFEGMRINVLLLYGKK